MKKSNNTYSLLNYIIVFIGVFLLTLISMWLDVKNNESVIKPFMTVAFLALGLYAWRLNRQGRLDASSLVGIIVMAGIIMRVGYMLYSHMYTRNHDLGQFNLDDGGHLSYILNIAEGHLPDSGKNLFYHPPFFHMTAALFYHIGQIFFPDSTDKAFSCVQIINCVTSCYMLMAFRGFLNEISLKDKYKSAAMAIVAFLPNFWLMGGRMNNDMIVTYCMLLCVIYTYRWYRDRDMNTIVLLALSFGIGMMAKISCAIMAFFTGPVMIYCAVKDFKNKEYKVIIKQLAVFAAICVPLGMWYPIRNFVLFEQPFNHVMRLSENHVTYSGNEPWYRRFLSVSPVILFKQPFANVVDDFSIPMHVIRTSVLGEWGYDGMSFIMGILNIVNLCMIIVSVVSMAYVVIKNKNLDIKLRFGFFAVWLLSLISFVQFNVEYPFICTADFRYIPIMTVMGAIYTAYAMQLADETDNKYVTRANKAAKVITAVWCMLCCAVYM